VILGVAGRSVANSGDMTAAVKSAQAGNKNSVLTRVRSAAGSHYWLSTGLSRARPVLCQPPQIVGPPMQFDVIRRSRVSRSTVAQFVASARFKTASSRGAQIPIVSAARPYVPSSAVSSLGGFRTPTAERAALSIKRPASETLHTSGSW
jgi:hypothetical protein